MPRRLGLAVALSFMFAIPSLAGAQSSASLTAGGMDLHLFRPAIDSKGHISVNGSEIIGHNHFSFGLVLDGGFGILPFHGFVNDGDTVDVDARRVDRVVQYAFTGTLLF